MLARHDEGFVSQINIGIEHTAIAAFNAVIISVTRAVALLAAQFGQGKSIAWNLVKIHLTIFGEHMQRAGTGGCAFETHSATAIDVHIIFTIGCAWQGGIVEDDIAIRSSRIPIRCPLAGGADVGNGIPSNVEGGRFTNKARGNPACDEAIVIADIHGGFACGSGNSGGTRGRTGAFVISVLVVANTAACIAIDIDGDIVEFDGI